MKVEEKRNMQKTIAFKNLPFVPEDNQVIFVTVQQTPFL